MRRLMPPVAAELFVPPSRFGDPSRRATGAVGTTIHFDDGATALCGTSGLWNVNLGYGDRMVAEAIARASRDASYLPLFRYGHTYAERAARALLRFVEPHAFGRVLFSTAGGAALDAAIKIARQYALLTEQSQRRLVVGLRGSYHGMTFGAFGLTGEDLGQAAYGVDQRLVRHVGHADPREFERLLRREGSSIAAVILEPLLGSGAHVVAPELIEAVLRARDEHGFLVVADEVASGFGRTGPAFASHGWPGPPDLLVTSKGLTNGTCAASAVLWAQRVIEAFDRHDAVLFHGETQAGSPQSCAAIEATIGQFAALDALERGRSVARQLDAWLGELCADVACVAEVRGTGCFRAIGLCGTDGSTLSGARIERVVAACRASGAIVHPGPSCIQLIPALTYEARELSELLERVRGVLNA
jgi:adenosylmethionine-8-amino-7-oxononanoate aminotransferase